MKLVIDVLSEVVFVLDNQRRILIGTAVKGRKVLDVPAQSSMYTYKRHIVMSGQCALCHVSHEHLDEACVSRTGHHAIVDGEQLGVEPIHCAGHWQVPLVGLSAEDLTVYVAPDNLFPVAPSTESFKV